MIRNEYRIRYAMIHGESTLQQCISGEWRNVPTECVGHEYEPAHRYLTPPGVYGSANVACLHCGESVSRGEAIAVSGKDETYALMESMYTAIGRVERDTK